MLRFVDIHPASLTPQIAAIGDGDVEERWKGYASPETLLETLDGPHSLVAKVVGELPEESCVGGPYGSPSELDRCCQHGRDAVRR